MLAPSGSPPHYFHDAFLSSMSILFAYNSPRIYRQSVSSVNPVSYQPGWVQAPNCQADSLAELPLDGECRTQQDAKWSSLNRGTLVALKRVHLWPWKSRNYSCKLVTRATQGLDGDSCRTGQESSQRMVEDADAPITMVNVRIKHNRGEGVIGSAVRSPSFPSANDAQVANSQLAQEGQKWQPDDGQRQQECAGLGSWNSTDSSRWQPGNAADPSAAGESATPAELAKKRFAMERGHEQGSDANHRTQNVAGGHDSEGDEDWRDPTQGLGSGGVLLRDPTGRLRRPSNIPMKRATRKHSGNESDGLPLPSTSAVFLTLGACMLALGLAITRYRTSRLTLPGPEAIPEASAMLKESTGRSQLLGHFKVEEAPLEDLRPVLADNSVQLRSAAATSFLQMQGAARQDGVHLVPLSGFRSVKAQEGVFYNIKAERNQPLAERAKVSAPPGYSEHHTGYALDIGDALAAETHLEFEFEHTEAFHWLQRNANRFHYEMSFPPGNEQQIMYEPWHWRFVGDNDSVHTFYGRNLR